MLSEKCLYWLKNQNSELDYDVLTQDLCDDDIKTAIAKGNIEKNKLGIINPLEIFGYLAERETDPEKNAHLRGFKSYQHRLEREKEFKKLVNRMYAEIEASKTIKRFEPF